MITLMRITTSMEAPLVFLPGVQTKITSRISGMSADMKRRSLICTSMKNMVTNAAILQDAVQAVVHTEEAEEITQVLTEEAIALHKDKAQSITNTTAVRMVLRIGEVETTAVVMDMASLADTVVIKVANTTRVLTEMAITRVLTARVVMEARTQIRGAAAATAITVHRAATAARTVTHRAAISAQALAIGKRKK
jgi:hypothetical protein